MSRRAAMGAMGGEAVLLEVMVPAIGDDVGEVVPVVPGEDPIAERQPARIFPGRRRPNRRAIRSARARGRWANAP